MYVTIIPPVLQKSMIIPCQDKTKDTIEVWRTSPETFFTHIERRGQSTISFPEVVRMSSEFDRRVAMMDDAFRSSIHRLSVGSLHLFQTRHD